MTRAQKRRRGARDSLWDLVVKCDDICFKHILPRLNGTDLNFLYEVNTETRKVIERSSRARDLKKGFKVSEMSSISTLEFAWEHKSLWSSDLYDERDFCHAVAHTNKLELLKWIREEKKCKWSSHTIYAAAEQGNLEMVKYCVANKCPMYEDACAYAAGNGHLEVLKYLREEVKATWDSRTASWAAENGHLHILEYLVERKYDKYLEGACMFAAMRGHLDCLKYLHETAKAPWDWDTATSAAKTGHLHILQYLVERKYDEYDAQACEFAAENGHLDCLKYLRETAKAPWDEDAVEVAYMNNHPECLQYLLDNNCPLPEGWGWRYEDLEGVRYEDLEVHAS